MKIKITYKNMNKKTKGVCKNPDHNHIMQTMESCNK